MKFVRFVLAALAAAFCLAAGAQTMTPAQMAQVCTYVKANPTGNAIRITGDTVSLQAWLDSAAAPVTLAWRYNLQPQEADLAANYSSFDSLAAGKRDSWALFLAFQRDFGVNKVRNWVTDVWGAATSGSVAEAVLQAGTKPMTYVQAVWGGTSKTTGTVTALDLVWDYNVPLDTVNYLVQPENCSY